MAKLFVEARGFAKKEVAVAVAMPARVFARPAPQKSGTARQSHTLRGGCISRML
ncbi:UNVERIFIED_CONTAM: hypothetical protein ABID98_004607 [Brevibacillus sp. OAP136]